MIDMDDFHAELNEIGISCQNVPLYRTGLNPLKDFKTILNLRNIFLF